MAFGNREIVHVSPTDTVVYVVKNSKGETLKTYKVPANQVETFQSSLSETRKELCSQFKTDVTVVKLERL